MTDKSEKIAIGDVSVCFGAFLELNEILFN